MTPIGYTRKNTGTFLAIAICVGASVLISMFVSNGAKFSDVKYLGIMAAILALFCILSDITSNFKNKKKIAYMKQMLSCPKTQGQVIDVKRIPYFFGREMKENPHIYPMGKNVVFRIVVSFYNASTGEEVMVTSEPYSQNVDSYIKDGYVNVHYSPNGEYWIDIS